MRRLRIRDVAIKGLAQYDHPKTAALLLAAYPQLPPGEKRAALATYRSQLQRLNGDARWHNQS